MGINFGRTTYQKVKNRRNMHVVTGHILEEVFSVKNLVRLIRAFTLSGMSTKKYMDFMDFIKDLYLFYSWKTHLRTYRNIDWYFDV